MLLWGSPVGAKIPVGFPAFLAITSVKISGMAFGLAEAVRFGVILQAKGKYPLARSRVGTGTSASGT